MGEVYKVSDIRLDRTLAVKFSTTEFSQAIQVRAPRRRRAREASGFGFWQVVAYEYDAVPDGQRFPVETEADSNAQDEQPFTMILNPALRHESNILIHNAEINNHYLISSIGYYVETAHDSALTRKSWS